MREVAEQVRRAQSLVQPLAPVSLPLSDALGLTAAADVSARWPSPPFTNSAMDGYALRRADVDLEPGSVVGQESAAHLQLVGESAAGRPFDAVVGPGQAIRIMTGAVMPAGADAIVPVEQASDDGTTVAIRGLSKPGAHIRTAGEDVAAGDVVVRAGEPLSPAALAAIASVGHGQVLVHPAPRVAIVSTGDELVEPGHDLAPGQIPDSNSVVLAGLLRQAGARPIVLPRHDDDPESFRTALTQVDADLIITTGGVSAGAYDVVKGALRDHGVDFGPVAMQPGKPQGLGTIGAIPIACLPGNPVAVLVTFVVVVRPMLRVLMGQPAPPIVTTVAAEGWNCPPGRQRFMPVAIRADGTVQPATAGGAGSHLVVSLAQADALASAPLGTERVEPGHPVTLWRWDR